MRSIVDRIKSESVFKGEFSKDVLEFTTDINFAFLTNILAVRLA